MIQNENLLFFNSVGGGGAVGCLETTFATRDCGSAVGDSALVLIMTFFKGKHPQKKMYPWVGKIKGSTKKSSKQFIDLTVDTVGIL